MSAAFFYKGFIKTTPSFVATIDIMTIIPGSPSIGGAIASVVIPCVCTIIAVLLFSLDM